jgi:hypothetical protein
LAAAFLGAAAFLAVAFLSLLVVAICN